MKFKIVLLLVVSAALVECKLYPIEFRVPLGGDEPPPGDIWPKPWKIDTTDTQYSLSKSSFKFTSNLASCDIISKAFTRYLDIIFIDSSYKPASGLDLIEQVEVKVAEGAKCPGYPTPDEDESYKLELPANGTTNRGLIEANSVWGALRGLETFAQLVFVDDATNELLMNQTKIEDWPRFKYRGVLFDTARHYLPKRTLLKNLDAMSYNKFNVFHWHMIDDQSFPFVSKTYPTLHVHGAYTPRHIYTPEDVQEIIEYARLRGIRVIPELASPAHTHAMARAYPQLLTPCYKNNIANQPNYPWHSESEVLNPMENFTFDFMKNLFQEFKDTFKDEYVHLGMDEVFYWCWETNPDITKFMQANGWTDYHQVEQYYVSKTLENVKSIGYKYVLWQDPLENGVELAEDAVVSVWKDTNLGEDYKPWQEYMEMVVAKKHQAILTSCWYLNYINYPYPHNDWEIYYNCDPHNFTGSDEEKKLVIGGQANIWMEFADHTNILARFWPRASAVGERLWSDPEQTNDVNTTRNRLDQQRCRMLRRGVPTAPLINGYCGAWEVDQDFDSISGGALGLSAGVLLQVALAAFMAFAAMWFDL